MGKGGAAASQEAAQDIVKPLTFDGVVFKHLRLSNNIEFLLVSDPELDKAGASVDVRVGSLSDPEDVPGLAHFLEHMLFYASEKYPEEDAYSRFLSEHGGHTNAYTAAENTNYHFECNSDSLAEALDRFSQFFISPLISEDGVEREVNAVDSEHSKNLNSDAWRKMQLWRHTAHPGHPFTRFHTGNLDTLLHAPKARGLRPHEEVRAFYARHYSANLMRGAVVAREPIQELEALVRAKFGAVPNTNLPPASFAEDVVTPEQTGRILRVVPEREGHRLELQWAVPPEQREFKHFPCGYMGHLLGHEGAGSVDALLKRRGWATALSAGEGGGSFSARSFFSVSITLTDEGFEHVEEIVALVFAYIGLIRSPDGVTAQRFKQFTDLAMLGFSFADKQGALSLAQSLASQLQRTPAPEVLLALYHVAQEYSADAVHAVLRELTPANLRVMLASKRFKGQTDLVEPWYSTEYSEERIPEAWLSSWREAALPPELHLPLPNPFISSDFALIQAPKQAEAAVPRVCHDSALLKLWHKPCVQFETPKAVIYLHFACPEAYVSPEAAVLTRLFVKLLSDDLNEMAYDAELAGLSYGLHNTKQGLLLTFYGYSHKLMELVRQVLKRVGNFPVRPDRFLVQKEAVTKEYANMAYQQPYQVAMFEAGVLLEQRRWHVREYEAVIGGLGAADLEAFLGRLTGRCAVEGYVTGNYGADRAAELAGIVEGLLKEGMRASPPFPSQLPEKRVLRLASGWPALLPVPAPNEDNANSAVVLAFQVGPDDLARNALLQLLVQATKRDAFHTLRTVEQLGYMVWLSTWATLTVQSLAFIVQSAAFTAQHLEARCEAFVGAMHQLLTDMSEDAFASHVEELAKAKLEKPKRLRQLAAREWREIDDGTLVFDRPAAEVVALRALTKRQLLGFFQEAVLDLRSRRKLSVHVLGSEKARAAAAAASAEADGIASAEPATNGEALHATDGHLANGTTAAGAADGQPPPAANGSRKGGGVERDGKEEAVAVEVITDCWAFKRAQEVYAAPK